MTSRGVAIRIVAPFQECLFNNTRDFPIYSPYVVLESKNDRALNSAFKLH